VNVGSVPAVPAKPAVWVWGRRTVRYCRWDVAEDP
jgi:hypothetical protein